MSEHTFQVMVLVFLMANWILGLVAVSRLDDIVQMLKTKEREP